MKYTASQKYDITEYNDIFETWYLKYHVYLKHDITLPNRTWILILFLYFSKATDNQWLNLNTITKEFNIFIYLSLIHTCCSLDENFPYKYIHGCNCCQYFILVTSVGNITLSNNWGRWNVSWHTMLLLSVLFFAEIWVSIKNVKCTTFTHTLILHNTLYFPPPHIVYLLSLICVSLDVI